LGYEVTWDDHELRDRSRPITLERYKAARERLIQSRATHLDQLTDKLREERVRRVIEPLLSGEPIEERFPEDDLQYLEDQGLIRRKPQLTIANRIYREILPREIIAPMQDVLTSPSSGTSAPTTGSISPSCSALSNNSSASSPNPGSIASNMPKPVRSC
jgi:hypothetical protein